MRTYYIDTDHLYSYIIWKDSETRRNLIVNKHQEEERIRYKSFKEILFNDNVKIKVPLIVMGELINNINRHHAQLDMNCVNYIYNEIFSIFKRDNIDFSAPNNESFSILAKIIDKDFRFDSTDALIVSQALADKNASHLLTLDRIITNSFSGGAVDSLNQDLCNQKHREKELKLYHH